MILSAIGQYKELQDSAASPETKDDTLKHIGLPILVRSRHTSSLLTDFGGFRSRNADPCERLRSAMPSPRPTLARSLSSPSPISRSTSRRSSRPTRARRTSSRSSRPACVTISARPARSRTTGSRRRRRSCTRGLRRDKGSLPNPPLVRVNYSSHEHPALTAARLPTDKVGGPPASLVDDIRDLWQLLDQIHEGARLANPAKFC